MRVSVSKILTASAIASHLMSAILVDLLCYLAVVFISIYLMTNDVGCLYTDWSAPFGEVYFQIFTLVVKYNRLAFLAYVFWIYLFVRNMLYKYFLPVWS